MTVDRRGRPWPTTADAATVDVVAPSRVADESERRDWYRAVAIGMAAFVVSRLCVLAGAGVRASQVIVDASNDGEPRPGTPLGLIASVLTQWDGLWYMEIVRGGYPRSIPPDITYFQQEARAAFFPLYPMLVAGRRPDPARWRHPRRAVREPRARRDRRRARRPARPPPVRHRRRRAGDGAVRRLPRVVRALVRLRRGAADRARRRLPAGSSSTSGGCSPASRPGSPRPPAPTASPSSPRAPSPP